MRRLPILLTAAGLAFAGWAVPSLAATHNGGYGANGRSTRSATGTAKKPASARMTSRTAATGKLFQSALAPSVPGDPMLDGASPGALPWVLKSGSVGIAGGHLRIDLKGFVIPGKGVGPVKTVSASLYCGTDTTPAASTPAAKLSPAGDASINAAVTLPKSCLAPVVLVHPNGQMNSYVAVGGWMS